MQWGKLDALSSESEGVEKLESRLKFNIIRQSMWAFLGKLVTATSSIFIGMVLSRILSPEELGTYFIAFSIASSLSLIGVFGFNTAAVKFVASALAHGELGRARKAVLLSGGGAAILSGILCSIYYGGGGDWLATTLFNSPTLSQMTGLISIWIFLAVMQIMTAECYRGFHQVGYAALINSSNSVSLIGLILLYSLVFPTIHLQDVLIITIGVLAIVVTISMGSLFIKVARLAPRGQLLFGELIRTAAPNGVTNAIYFMLGQFDLWIIGVFKSGGDVAIYGAASKLVKLVGMPLMIVSLVAPPLVAKMYASGQLKELQKVLRAFATLAGWPSLFVLCAFILAGKSILALVFGGYYAQGVAILAILSLGQIVNVWSGSCGILLAMTGNHRILMYITIFCGSLVLVLGLVLVKNYGMLAVAVVSAGGMLLQNVLMLLAARRTVGVWSHMEIRIHPWAAFKVLKSVNNETMTERANE